MEALKVGMKHVAEREVTEAMTTRRGDYRVFSTPSMVQFCEASAGELIAPHLQPGQGQVGIVVTIRHMGPTPMGKRVGRPAAKVQITSRPISSGNQDNMARSNGLARSRAHSRASTAIQFTNTLMPGRAPAIGLSGCALTSKVRKS